MRMISRDVTGPVLLLFVLCWVAAGSMGPNRDEKTVKSSEKCLQELDCPDEPQTDKRTLNKILRPKFMQNVGPMAQFFNNFKYNFQNPGDLQLVEKNTGVASIYNKKDKYPEAAFAFFEFVKGKKGITEKEFPNNFHQDPGLEQSVQPRKTWFVNSGFDCGHMLPRQFLNYGSTDLLYEICSFAFVIPQARRFNQVYWKGAENKAKGILEELTPQGGKQKGFIMTFTSDKVISYDKVQNQFVYTPRKMSILKGKTGEVPIRNSIGQVVSFPKFNSRTGKLEKVKYVAYFGNNSDSNPQVSFVTLKEFEKWQGMLNVVENIPDVIFEQVVV